MSQGFNHFDENGNAVMVDVSGKNITYRTAVATGEIHVGEAIMEAVKEGSVKKGDVLGVARVAGIMGVKRTSELIPMCHPLPIQKCSVDYELDETNGIIRAFCTVKTEGKTGVEMEALTGVQVTLLTIYDMCKAIDKHMVMSNIHLVEKTGGKSGEVRNEKAPYIQHENKTPKNDPLKDLDYQLGNPNRKRTVTGRGTLDDLDLL